MAASKMAASKMAAKKIAVVGMLASVFVAGCTPTRAQSTDTPPSQTDTQSSSSGSTDAGQSGVSSSSKTAHRKTGASSSETIRHTRIAEEDAGAAQMARAEDLIQKKNYSAAEPLLRQALESDPANYVAWFDLAFAENGLGNTEDSIAAYRKSVKAKPDVFDGIQYLGSRLAKPGQPDAEQFLRSATQLKPTDHVAEGQGRAWISLGQVLEKSRPDDAVAAYRKASELRPNDPEPRLEAGLLLEKQGKFADAEQEYKQALALDPSSDALTGLANIYMRGRRLPDAEEYLRKLVATH